MVKKSVKKSSPTVTDNIFTITSKTALLEENRDGQPILEETVKTYYINRSRNKFYIKELGRKNNRPKAVTSFTAKRGDTVQTIISDIQLGKKVLPAKHTNTRNTYSTKIENKSLIKTKTGTVTVIQTNYLSKINYVQKGLTIKIKPQMVCLIKVTDSKNMISDYFVGYSKKMQSSRPDAFALHDAEMDCKYMAIAKFLVKYPKPYYKKFDSKNSIEYFECEIIEKRFQYWKTKSYKL